MADTSETVDRVGLGVDLIGGPEVLTDLRAIRVEYEAIIALGGKANQATGASLNTPRTSATKNIEQEEAASNKRRAKASVDTAREVSDEEVKIYADTAQRRAEIKRRGDAELLRREKETQAELNRVAAQAAAERERVLTQNRNAFSNPRNPALSQAIGNASPIAFRRSVGVVEGPDNAVNKAQRLAQNENLANDAAFYKQKSDAYKKFVQEQELRLTQERNQYSNARSRALSGRLEGDIVGTRGDIGVVRRVGPSPYGLSSAVPVTAARQAAQEAADAAELKEIQEQRAERTATLRRQKEINRVNEDIRTRQLLVEGATDKQKATALNNSAKITAQNILSQQQQNSQVKDYRAIEASNAIKNKAQIEAEAEQLRKNELVSKARQSQSDRAYVRSQLGTGGPPKPPSFGEGGDALNQRGFFTTADAVGRITRNLLIYQGISLVTKDLYGFVEASVEAAKKSVDLGHALDFATEQAHGSIEANRALRDSYAAIGETRQQAQNVVIQAARFTQNRPQDTKGLADTITNVAASRGLGIANVGELIQQIRDRKPRVFEELFNTKPEDLYKQFAANKLDTDSGQGFRGINDIRGNRASQISKIVSALSDQQKHEIELNYILSQSSKYSGEAADRANTLAGRIDRIGASLSNATEIVGLFITEIKPLGDLFDNLIGKASLLEKLRPPELGRTGPENTISDADVQKFARESTTGPRAKALADVNTFGAPLIEGGIAVAGLALFGRNQAKANFQLASYNKILEETAGGIEGATNAAKKAALDQVTNLKPGLIRSVESGLQRITVGMTESVSSITRLPPPSALKYNPQQSSNLFYGNTGPLKNISNGDISRTALVGPQGPYSLYSSPADTARYQKLQGNVAAGAGIAGAIVGASLGTIVAEKLNVGPIVATGLTIAGGIIGNAVGTTIGEVIGASLIRYVVANGGLLAAAGTAAAAAGTSLAFLGGAAIVGGGAAASTQTLTSPYLEEQALKRREAEAVAYAQQAKEDAKLRAEGRIRYRSTRAGDTLDLLRPEDVARRGDAIGDGQGGLANYAKEIIPPLTEAQKVMEDFNKERDKILDNKVLPQDVKDKKIAELQSAADQAAFDARNPDYANYHKDYLARQEDSITKRLNKDRADAEREAQKRNEYIQRQSAGLSKLRFASDASFELVGRNAEAVTGADNPYTKALADQITLSERMVQQWGFLGQGVVDYQTKLQKLSDDRALLGLDYAAYTKASDLRGQVQRETDQRNGPGLSRKDQEYLDIQNAIVDRAKQIPELWKQAAEVLGQTNLTQQQQFAGRIALINQAYGVQGPRLRNVYGQDITPGTDRRNAYGQYLGDNFDIETRKNVYGQSLEDPAIAGAFSAVGAGQSKEVQRAIQKSYADTLLDAFKGLTPAEIRRSGYGDVYLGAIKQQGRSLQDNISQAREKAQYGAIEDQRLSDQLKADAEFRQKEIAGGADAADVGRASDALLIARTNNVPVKDLTFEQFKNRSEALQRQADQAENDRKEAAQAVKDAQTARLAMVDGINSLKEAIINGDMKVLIQVENDTQAKVDTERLQNANPSASPRDVKPKKSNYTNPAKDSKRRYGSMNGVPTAYEN